MAGWTTGSYAIVQALRLITNVILARILSPQLFGIMLIINTLRTGMDLVSDIGVGQNVIHSKHTHDPMFLDTAWTLQIIRGVILSLVFCAAAYPLSILYDAPILLIALPAASLYFLFLGFTSMGHFLLQKRMHLVRWTAFEVGVAVFSAAVHIGLALLWPSLWSLIWAGVLSSAAWAIGSYFLVPGLRHRPRITRDYTLQIIAFGKWVFLSSIVYFLAMNFDRLYMAKAISLELLGIYGVARSLADVLSLLAARFGNLIIFPIVAAADLSRDELRAKLAHARPKLLITAALAVSLFAAISDLLIQLLYDERYQAAGAMLPILAMGVWFAILCTLNEAVLLGIGRPAYGAIANTIKLGWLLVGLPIAVTYHGVAGAIVVIAAAEFVRYVPLWHTQRREGLSFLRQDVIITLFMLAMCMIWRSALVLLGISDNLLSFWTLPSL